MLRALGVGGVLRRFSKISMVDGVGADVSGLQNISKLPFYLSFKQGLNLTMQRRLQQANQSFQRALNQLQQRRQQLNEHYLYIFKKMVANNLALGRVGAAEENLYGLIKMKKRYNFQSVLMYDDYDTLFQLFLRHNVQKAILLGKALLTEKELQGMSLRHKKLFLFNLASAYFLNGNYTDAKTRYSECLNNDPAKELKVRVYNNLGLACWWHKNPLYGQAGEGGSGQAVDGDFRQSKEIFLRAIQTAQMSAELSAQQRYKLKQALSEYELDITARFSHRQSVLPMYNLCQYYINNEPGEKMKILYWLRSVLQLAKLTGEERVYDEVSSTLCILNNERKQLERVVGMGLEKYKGRVEEVYYCRLGGLLAAGEGRKEEAQKLSRRAGELEEEFRKRDQYVFKRKFLNQFDLVL